MPWGSLIGAVGGLLSDGGGSQPTQTQTVSKDPWSAADPWLRQQITTGQQLQNYYQTNPFNAQQQQAYGQLSQGNAYTNALVPSLLGQISGQSGFDRSNPRARPAGINFNVGGNLGFGAGNNSGAGGGGDQSAYDRAYQRLDAQHREKYGIPFAMSGDKAGMERELAQLRAETGMSGSQGSSGSSAYGYGLGTNMNVTNNPFANGGINPPAQAQAAAAPATNPAQDEMYRWWLQNSSNQYNNYGGGGGGGGGDGGF
jgi:hypothetical protein